MGYILGQYNKNRNVHDDNIFMSLVTNGTARRKTITEDFGVSGITGIFTDECVQVGSLLNTKNYYFHGKIKRLDEPQTFYIKLINFSDTGVDKVEQYIKTITVAKGDYTDWVDVEFIFSPLITFDTILFELQREAIDFSAKTTRYPLIAYEELSEVKNIINERIKENAKLIRIGVQSRPGLMMCINGEEIRTSRTGVYELKNGVMTVNFFSICAPVKEADNSIGTDNTMSGWIARINNLNLPYGKKEEESKCFFNTSKQSRVIDSFTLDYMYKE